jgi:general secretion pathway protein G
MTRQSNDKAFTLIELLVVIAIIGVLSTLAVVAYAFARNQSKIAKAQHDVDAFVTALKLLENDTGQWPGHQQVDRVTTSGSNEVWDLGAANAGIAATDGNFPGWNGPYMGVVRPDPWGNPYFYDSDYIISGENRVVIGSFGPNEVGPNLYDADDIIKILR